MKGCGLCFINSYNSSRGSLASLMSPSTCLCMLETVSYEHLGLITRFAFVSLGGGVASCLYVVKWMSCVPPTLLSRMVLLFVNHYCGLQLRLALRGPQDEMLKILSSLRQCYMIKLCLPGGDHASHVFFCQYPAFMLAVILSGNDVDITLVD